MEHFGNGAWKYHVSSTLLKTRNINNPSTAMTPVPPSIPIKMTSFTSSLLSFKLPLYLAIVIHCMALLITQLRHLVFITFFFFYIWKHCFVSSSPFFIQ
ncbi:hypothetical protein BCR42DRAFT_410811 [Absidia repens]|uniref:Uncharacterized protein n=1 Tax=Absidia repens TaxID=90262 RepID=A0A1X2IPH6_9FUNG|nr:hypothetical protein BCR42DRAFT_410811 [Absidia repens]